MGVQAENAANTQERAKVAQRCLLGCVPPRPCPVVTGGCSPARPPAAARGSPSAGWHPAAGCWGTSCQSCTWPAPPPPHSSWGESEKLGHVTFLFFFFFFSKGSVKLEEKSTIYFIGKSPDPKLVISIVFWTIYPSEEWDRTVDIITIKPADFW